MTIDLDRRFDSPSGTVAWGAAGAGPRVVMVHGTPFSSYVWQRLAAVLAQDFEVVLIDLLGYGASEKAQRVSLDVQGAMFAAFVEHLGGPAPAVVAHDFGGTAALRAHLLHGADYDRLILLDPVALAPWGSDFVSHVTDHEAAFAGMPAAYHRALLEAYVPGAAHRALRPDDLAAILAPWLGDEGQRAFYRQIAQMDERYTEAFRDKLGAVRCPVDLFWGEEDAWLPVADGDRLAELIRPRRYVKTPGAGHLVQLDAPEQVLAFLYRGLR